MSSEIFLCAVTFVLVGCAIILWFLFGHVKKRRRPHKKIWLCSDVLMDILPFFDHAQLGLKMALLSDRFDVLVDAHFDGKTTELAIWREIRIRKSKGTKAKGCKRHKYQATLFVLIGDKFVGFPLPDRPLPNKIRLRLLQIYYIDHSVITFFRSNKPIWDRSGIKLELSVVLFAIDKQHIWDVLVHEIWPIISTNIRHLSFAGGAYLDNLRRLVSPTILTDLDQLNSIDSDHLCPDGIADDGPNATAGQALSKWLHTPRKNRKPNELRCCAYFCEITWTNTFKETFLRATTSVAYNVRLKILVASQMNTVEQFELVNEVTQEKLTLIKEAKPGTAIVNCLLKRCPIVGETATVQQEKDENLDHLNGLIFHFHYDWIGPLSPPDLSDEKMFSTPGPSSDQQKKE